VPHGPTFKEKPMTEIFSRTELLLGTEVMKKLAEKRVIIFGIGGVGSWCAEALVRSGIHHLTIVDADNVSITNVNRQIMATTQTIGEVKVEVFKQRLQVINPDAEIIAVKELYNEQTAEKFKLDEYDYVIDAIDSLKDKALLILNATQSRAVLFSSMGAALKLDPSKINVTEFWKVRGDPLAAALRRKFKKQGTFPKRKFKCVYSEELLSNKYVPEEDISASPIFKAQVNGSIVHITAMFGLMLNSLVIQDVVTKMRG